MKNHPYADLFPMMSAAELDALAADVKEYGLRHPIVTHQGAILDGRNRLLACHRAGVEPTFSDYDGDDPLGLVISLNVQRRDMTSAQRAIVAAKTTNAKQGRPSKNGTSGTVFTVDDAAKVFNIGVRQVKEARAILADAPDLAAQVEGRTLDLAKAYEQVQARRKEAEQKARDAERVAEYQEAISNGQITLDEALRRALDDARTRREKEEQDALARRLWFDGLRAALKWAREDLAESGDDYIVWYTKAGAPGADPAITDRDIEALIAQFQRMRIVGTFNGSK